MNIRVDMTVNTPTVFGKYYVVEKHGDRNPALAIFTQGPKDYFPYFRVGQKEYTMNEAKDKFFFSKESVNYTFVLETKKLVRVLV